jgi:hypothetical protein
MTGLDAGQIEAFKALFFGFALAGFVATGFQLLTNRLPSFSQLTSGGLRAALSVPLLMTTAPFIILRNTIRGRRFERRSIFFIWLATVIACLWSLAAGKAVLNIMATLVG